MSEAMNIIIAGSRDFDDYRLLKKTVSDYIEENQVNNTQQIRVISGGAKGADRLGECYAFDNGYSVSDESTYRKYHGRIGQTVSAVLVTKTYDDGEVRQYINRLGGL